MARLALPCASCVSTSGNWNQRLVASLAAVHRVNCRQDAKGAHRARYSLKRMADVIICHVGAAINSGGLQVSNIALVTSHSATSYTDLGWSAATLCSLGVSAGNAASHLSTVTAATEKLLLQVETIWNHWNIRTVLIRTGFWWMLMHLVVDRFSKAGSPNLLFFLVQYIHVYTILHRFVQRIGSRVCNTQAKRMSWSRAFCKRPTRSGATKAEFNFTVLHDNYIMCLNIVTQCHKMSHSHTYMICTYMIIHVHTQLDSILYSNVVI